jgi:hypothetical protein
VNLHYKPTAAELVAAVAEFLETEMRESGQLTDALNFHTRVAANVLRIVERELLAEARDTADGPLQALNALGFDDETALAAAIRSGAVGDEVLPALHALVAHRQAVAHPGYERE